MPFFTTPTSFRLNQQIAASNAGIMADQSFPDYALEVFKNKIPPHSSHPEFGHLVLLVFEAVMEVVCVSLPGYVLARQGLFDAEAQKFVANLNVNLFTPCLVFTKLASQLTSDKLLDLAVIPAIFIVQTCVSYVCARGIARLFGFHKRATNFVIAMGVFGNSNSLPISLVLSLSKTISGLHWDRIPGDNDNEVAARGILYLLIFQQLGQMLRWSWGYNVLLKPAHSYSLEDGGLPHITDAGEYRDDPEDSQSLLSDWTGDDETQSSAQSGRKASKAPSYSDYESGNITPELNTRNVSSSSSINDATIVHPPRTNTEGLLIAAPGSLLPTCLGNGKVNRWTNAQLSGDAQNDDESRLNESTVDQKSSVQSSWIRLKRRWGDLGRSLRNNFKDWARAIFDVIPSPLQKFLAALDTGLRRFLRGLWSFMNPPLWAIIVALIVASVPQLQSLFFDKGTFVNNSVTRAVAQNGGVAVPLILVVLGANLARNTLPKSDSHNFDDPKEERNLLIASLVSRMFFPMVVMAPLLAVTAKYVPVSILDDPIFVIVCFLLTGAPSALQLAQICQINNVYMGAMSRLLFQSYVIWILPSTLILVMLALEVVEWAVV